MQLPADTLRYLISFLVCSDRAEDVSLIAYTSDPNEYRGHPLAIVPAPVTPNKDIIHFDGCPVFHGQPFIKRDGDTIVLHADIIATTFYLLSRYDEYQSTAPLDIYSRFMPENSLLGANGLLETPIIDQYTELIYRLLNRPKPKRRSRVYLTHDIDMLTRYRRPRGFLGGLYRLLIGTNPHPFSTVLKSLADLHNDPAYTYPILQHLDAALSEKEIIYFVKPDNTPFAPLDRPVYSHSSADFKTLENLPIGLHSLYTTCDCPDTLPNQFASIEKLPNHLRYHRSHYLRILPPTEMHRYSDAGITDDFTLSYASTLGFRLGTTRPSRAIDPSTGALLPLMLHPLTIMDTTLVDERYLNLNYEKALERCLNLFETIKKYQGDITLLFHNTFITNPIIGKLYPKLLENLNDLES